MAGLLVSFFCLSPQAIAQTRDASLSYSLPFPGMNPESKLNFAIGQSLFEKFWVPSPSSTTASDGLGPLFNARSCHSCHLKNGRGHLPKVGALGSSTPSFFIRLGLKNVTQPAHGEYTTATQPDPLYGHQLQTFSLAGLSPEGDYRIGRQSKSVTFSDGSQVVLSKPSYTWQNFSAGPLSTNTGISARVSPPLVGMGLLDAVPAQQLIALADPDDNNQDGISGKVNRVWDAQNQRWSIGKFGYKATQPTLNQQNQGAFNGDLGLSTPLFPNASGDCTARQIDCLNAPNGNSAHLSNLEIDAQQINLVNHYLATSMPPVMRNIHDERFEQGKATFLTLGCQSCHTPKLTTGQSNFSPLLSQRDFYPFTDLLLHDMGEGLASGMAEFDAQPREWRTAPLWGIGLSEQVSKRKGFLHDGRANTLEEAILWHGGEAENIIADYLTLSKHQRNTLIYFLESL